MASFRIIVASKKILLQRGAGFEIVAGFVEIVGSQIFDVIVTTESAFDQKLSEYRALDRVKVCHYQDALVTPAFVNAHTHVTMAFFRGLPLLLKDRKNIVEDAFFKVESKLTAEDVRAFSRMGGYECLLNGVGVVWDHYYFGTAVAEALLDIGMCGVVAPTLQDKSGPGVTLLEKMLEETLEIKNAKRYEVGGVFAAFGPHATDTVSPELWKRIAASSKSSGLPVHAHLGQSIDEMRRAQDQFNCSPVEMLQRNGVFDEAQSCLWAHGIYLSDADFQKLKKQNQSLVFCPYSQLIFHFPADIDRWEKHDVNWVVATDCVASNDSMNVQKELRFVSGSAAMSITKSKSYSDYGASGNVTELKAVEALRSDREQKSKTYSDPNFLLPKVFGTAGNLHPQFVAGKIEKDALANLVVWDMRHPSFWPSLDPLATLCRGDTAGAIINAVVAGRIVGEDYNYVRSIIKSVDYEDARAEAERRLAKLLDAL